MKVSFVLALLSGAIIWVLIYNTPVEKPPTPTPVAVELGPEHPGPHSSPPPGMGAMEAPVHQWRGKPAEMARFAPLTADNKAVLERLKVGTKWPIKKIQGRSVSMYETAYTPDIPFYTWAIMAHGGQWDLVLFNQVSKNGSSGVIGQRNLVHDLRAIRKLAVLQRPVLTDAQALPEVTRVPKFQSVASARSWLRRHHACGVAYDEWSGKVGTLCVQQSSPNGTLASWPVQTTVREGGQWRDMAVFDATGATHLSGVYDTELTPGALTVYLGDKKLPVAKGRRYGTWR